LLTAIFVIPALKVWRSAERAAWTRVCGNVPEGHAGAAERLLDSPTNRAMGTSIAEPPHQDFAVDLDEPVMTRKSGAWVSYHDDETPEGW
jgi:hypothetical protein